MFRSMPHIFEKKDGRLFTIPWKVKVRFTIMPTNPTHYKIYVTVVYVRQLHRMEYNNNKIRNYELIN